jgi:hypothetical protein
MPSAAELFAFTESFQTLLSQSDRYPQRLTMADIAKFSNEKSKLPTIAEPKPCKWIPGTSPDTNHSMRALITRRNSPSVSIVKGKVRITMTGFTKKLTRPKTMAPMNAEPQPSTYNPGTSLETNRRRAALIIRRIRSSIINQPFLRCATTAIGDPHPDHGLTHIPYCRDQLFHIPHGNRDRWQPFDNRLLLVGFLPRAGQEGVPVSPPDVGSWACMASFFSS